MSLLGDPRKAGEDRKDSCEAAKGVLASAAEGTYSRALELQGHFFQIIFFFFKH